MQTLRLTHRLDLRLVGVLGGRTAELARQAKHHRQAQQQNKTISTLYVIDTFEIWLAEKKFL